jgi:hypothetical protein
VCLRRMLAAQALKVPLTTFRAYQAWACLENTDDGLSQGELVGQGGSGARALPLCGLLQA